MKNILVIGGAGYIGTVLTDHFLNAGHRVRSLDCFLYKNNHCILPFLFHENFDFVYGDLCDSEVINRALADVTDVVVLAGLVGDPITKKYPELADRINDRGIKNCIDCLDGKSLERVVFVSTCSNYGLIDGDELAGEDFELKPLSRYAEAKVSAEKHILSLKDKVDYVPTILRFATAFGLSPRMRFDLTVSEFTKELALGKELLVFDAKTWRPYCHVKDFARLIDLVLGVPDDKVSFEVFNAGGDINNYTKQGIVDAVLQHLPDSRIVYQERGSDPRNYRVDFSKVRNVLGFEPAYTVPMGIQELLDAFADHLFDNLEDLEGIYGNYTID